MSVNTAESVVSYLGGELGPDDESAFEDELFAGDHDGGDLTGLSTLLVGIREAAFLGILNLLVPIEHAEKMRANGYRVLVSRMMPGEETVVDVSEDFDLLFVEFVIDLDGVTELVAEICDSDGVPFKRNEAISVPPGLQSISGYCARDLALASAHALPNGIITRVYSVEAGGERLLGEYRGRMVLGPGGTQSG
jgi:hypothetical protein